MLIIVYLRGSRVLAVRAGCDQAVLEWMIEVCTAVQRELKEGPVRSMNA